jgi:hypothetical protein
MNGAENYKLAIELLLLPDSYRPLIAVLDSGASHNIIREDALPQNWQESGMVDPDGMTRSLQDARGAISQNVATVYLQIKLGCEKRQLRFLVMKELAVPVLLGCEFIDDHVTSIRSKDKTIQMNSGTIIPLYRRPILKTPTPVYLAQPILLPPFSETNVPVTTENEGTCLIQAATTNRTFQKRNYATAPGISDVKNSQVFMLKVANYGKKPILLQKHTTMGIATTLSTEVLTFSETSGKQSEPTKETVYESDWKEDLKIDHLSPNEQEQVVSMLSKHNTMWTGSLGEISITKHLIQLQSGAKPVYQPPYRAGVKAREVEKAEVDRMLAAGVIEPAVSEWASPVVLITKPDGSVRFCVDYRKLNALTIKDSYPLPRMDECLDSLGDATIFSTLDCNSGYWQILMKEEDRNKTAFVTHCGVHQFKRMPFGLCNAPATFQRALDMILAKVKWNYALIYLDDVIIYSKTVEEHMTHLDEVLGLLRTAGASLKLKKCHFFQTKVNYLGHVIYPGKLAVAQKNIDTLEKAVYPTKRTELRSFLGMCNVYRRFVERFAKIAAPLTDLLKKGQPETFELNTEQQKSFHVLRDALIEPPILTLPKEGKSYTLDVDACDYQIGACLLQQQDDGKLLPCGYYSRTLNGAERNYSTPEKECLAVVWATLLLRPYLEGTSFTVRSDQVALKWLLSFKDPSGRLARWRLRLAEFDFTIQYRPGIQNNLADGCSRVQSKGSDENKCDDAIPCFSLQEELALSVFSDEEIPQAITLEEIHQAQQEEGTCQTLTNDVLKGNSKFYIERVDGKPLLYRQANDPDHRRIYIPVTLRQRVLHLAHYPTISGHPGAKKMFKTLCKEFYWPTMVADVYEFVKLCHDCTKENSSLRKRSKQITLFPAEQPLDFVAIDILGPLTKTIKGHQYLLVIADRFSKLVRTIPLKTITTFTVASAFCHHWVFIYGAPRLLLSDNGTQFNSKFFQACCQILGIHQKFTTAYHPQCNGQVERFNRTILSQLRKYIGEHQNDWDLFNGALTYAYNTQVHTSTGCTPFELILSRPPSTLILQPEPKQLETSTLGQVDNVKTGFLRRLQTLIPQAQAAIARMGQRYQGHAAKSTRKLNDECLVNKQVWVRAEGAVSKLHPKLQGPYHVTRDANDYVTIEVHGEGTRNVSKERVVQVPATDDVTQTHDGKGYGDIEYVIEKIVDEDRNDKGHPIYRVRWEGYSKEDDTWEVESSLPLPMVLQYLRNKVLARSRRKKQP